jgi:hypothetical protein
MSNAMLEAIAAGLPVITTDNGSHPVVDAAGCGVTVRRGDRQSLLAALQRLYCDEHLRCRLAEAGLEYARSIPWRTSAEAFAQVFQALRSGRRRGDAVQAARVPEASPVLINLPASCPLPAGQAMAAQVLPTK